MSEFENGKMSPWGYIIDAQTLPNLLNESEFSAFTGGKFIGDRRITANIPSATASIRNFCGWHIAPNLTCGALFNIHDLKDAFVGSDLNVQLPATFITSIDKIIVNAKLNADTGEYEGDELTDFDIIGKGLVKVYDVSARDRKARIFIKYKAGFSLDDIAVIKELAANKVTHAVTNTYGVNSEAAGGVSVSYNSAWTGSGSTSFNDDSREVLDAYKVKGVY